MNSENPIKNNKKNNLFYTLYSILKMDRNKSEWSNTQTEKDRINYMINEIEELREELNKNNKETERIKDEIGDILWNLLASIVIIEEKYNINVNDVLQHIINKIKRRKPKLFSENKTLKKEDELKDWYSIKKTEKNKKTYQKP